MNPHGSITHFRHCQLKTNIVLSVPPNNFVTDIRYIISSIIILECMSKRQGLS